MAEIVNIDDHRRTCQNCRFWVPPQYMDGRLVKESRCGRPGGWTPRWIGPPGPYQRMECNEFKRRDSNAKI